MDKVINIINLGGWAFLLLHVGLQLFADPQSFVAGDISLDVLVLQAIQLFQISDIILILLKISKGSIMGAFFQILGRNIVSLYFISAESDRLRFATVVVIWAMADVNRYLYYLFKTSPITGFLRYNSFLVLYPVGVYGQMMVINDFIKRNAQTISDNHVNVIRAVQFLIIVGMLYLYSYMLKSRQRYMKSQTSQEAQTKPEAAASSQKSPRKEMKRD